MQKKGLLFTVVVLLVFTAFSQHPLKHFADAVEMRFDNKQPVVHYILTVDSADLSLLSVEMRLRNISDTVRIAIVAHPEYDDRYWRYIENMHVEASGSKAAVVREDSSLWLIIGTGKEAVIHYRLRLPAVEGQRAAWRPFLSHSGGLIGGVHSFMYVVGATLAPAHVTLRLPDGWDAVTGLEPTADPYTFYAPSVAALVDAPVLIGKLKQWRFVVDGVPHRVAYQPLSDTIVFDTTKLVTSVQKLVEQAALLFGRLPYREYSFLMQDGAYGALEHSNSVTLGLPATELAKGEPWLLNEVAHEYFHTWNIMRIRPAEYGDVSYKKPPLSRGLWFSEGLTMFYADLLLRRANLPVQDSTRRVHFKHLIHSYFGNPGNSVLSPEKVSLAEYGPNGMLGDYSASSHLQGEVLGAMLDMIIRDKTNGKRTMDDVMLKMLERFSGEKGFTGRDVEQAVTEVCACNVHQFFEDHVRGNKVIDFKKHLKPLGLTAEVKWKDARNNDGELSPDLRIFPWQDPGDKLVTITVIDPASCWVKAGLHTGDKIVAVNGARPKNDNEVRQLIRKMKIGESLLINVQRPTGMLRAKVIITGYKQPEVLIQEIAEAGERAKMLKERWAAGK